MDVEGFEKILLEGFFAEVPKEYLPPVINFESRVLKPRGGVGVGVSVVASEWVWDS